MKIKRQEFEESERERERAELIISVKRERGGREKGNKGRIADRDGRKGEERKQGEGRVNCVGQI